jgi:hypothetical protein
MFDRAYFLHSSIASDHRIEHCVVISEKSQSSVNVAILFERSGIMATIGQDVGKVQFEIHESFTLELPLTWIAAINDYLVAFSVSHQLIISEIGPPMRRISLFDMRLTCAETPEPFCHFVISRSREYLVVTGRLDHAMIVRLSEPEHPEMNAVFFPGHEVLSVAPVSSAHDFIVLAVSPTGAKHFITFSAETHQVTKIEDADVDVCGFINTDDRFRTFIPMIRRDSVQIRSKDICSIPAGVDFCSDLVHGCFVARLTNDTMVALCNDPKAEATITELPPFRKMWLLPNRVLVTASANYVVCLPKFSTARANDWPVSFSTLVPVELPETPEVRDSVTFRGRVYVAGSSDVYEYKRRCKVHLDGPIADVPEDRARLFSLDGDRIVVSSAAGTRSLHGNAAPHPSSTVAMVPYGKKFVQVVSNCLIELNSGVQVTSDSRIVAAASNNQRFAFIDEDSQVTLFQVLLKQPIVAQFPQKHLTCLAVGDVFVAVGTNDSVLILDQTLGTVGEAGPFPAPCRTAVFRHKGRELLVSLDNGVVLRTLLDAERGFVGDFVPIFVGRRFLRLLSVRIDGNPIFMIDGRLTIYTDDGILKTSMPPFQSLVAAVRREEGSVGCMIYVLSDHALYSFSYSQLRSPQFYDKIEEAPNAIFVTTEDFLFVVARSSDSFRLLALPVQVSSEPLPGRVLLATGLRNRIVLLLSTSELRVFDFTDHVFRYCFATTLQFQPTQIAFYFKHLFIAFETALYIAFIDGDHLRFRPFILALPSPIKSLVVRGFIWAVFEDGRVATLLYEPSSARIEFLAVSHMCGIHAVFPVDDLSAFVRASDDLYFIRVRLDVFHGFPSREPRDYLELAMLRISNVATLCKAGDSVVYFTPTGGVGALIGINCSKRFWELKEIQCTVQRYYQKYIGFSIPPGRLPSRDLVDLDLLTSYRAFSVGEADSKLREDIFELALPEKMQLVL